jgi:hypothetical protein
MVIYRFPRKRMHIATMLLQNVVSNFVPCLVYNGIKCFHVLVTCPRDTHGALGILIYPLQ